MRCWKRIEPPQIRSRAEWMVAPLLALSILFSAPLFADGISVEYTASSEQNGVHQLDANISFDFNEEIIVALEHGVAINIVITIYVKRERDWLWDPVVAEKAFSYTLQHRPLSEDYIVTEIESGARQQFPTYEAALQFIGTIDNAPLLSADSMLEDAGYTGHIKARLNPESLPAPLQPIAYVSGVWRIESSWYEWVVRERRR